MLMTSMVATRTAIPAPAAMRLVPANELFLLSTVFRPDFAEKCLFLLHARYLDIF